MRKLKVALTLLFAMCFSLFLFACGGGKSGLKSVSVEGDIKTTYAETDTAKAFSIDGMVVKVIYKEGMKTDDNGNVIPVELKGSEYTVDASAIKWGTVGTYPVIVTPNGQKEVDPSLTQEVVGTYEVKIEHAYGEADENGEKVCSVCEARMRNVTVDDTVEIGEWGGAPAVEKKDDKSPITQPRHYATYGTVGIGQRITVRGTALNLNLSADWFFPIIGFANGNKGVVARNDGWTILDGPGKDFVWPNHADGETAANGTVNETSEEWAIFMNGTTCTSRDYVPEAQMELTWNYREDGVMQLIFNNISVGKKVTFELKVPAASYDAVLYGEHVKMHITEVEIEKNLSIKNFEVLHGANKLAYAENTMFNEDGIVTKATYNKGITSEITSYDLYADVVTGEGDNKVTTTYDLRTTPLTKDMSNFRISFSGYSSALDVKITESVIKGVNPDWDVKCDSIYVHADDVNYVYDLNENKEITIFASGSASKITDDLRDAIGSEYDDYGYYISFRLLGGNRKVKDGSFEVGNVGDSVIYMLDWKNGNGELIALVKANAEGKIAPFTITLKEITTSADDTVQPPVAEVTVDREIKVDTTNLTIPAVSSLQSGKAYIDVGGEIEVTFEGAVLKEDISTYTFFAGSKRLSYNDLNKLNAAENPVSEVVAIRDSLVITKFAHNKTNGTLVITYKLLAPNLARAFTNSFNVSVQKGGETLADETLVYTYAMSSTLGGGYVKVSDGYYVKADGTRLIALRFNNEINVKANSVAEIMLNIQNDSAEMYNLSVKALAGNSAEFVAANALTKVTSSAARVSILGTVGNAEDYDRGAALISVVDVTAIGLRSTTDTKTQTYYFEVNGGNMQDGYTIGTVNASDEITFATGVKPEGEPAGTRPGDCLLGTMKYYEYGQTGFYFGQVGGGVGDGKHDYVGEKDKDKVCSKCGSRIYKETKNKMDIAAFTENVVTRGITLSFDVKGATGDWTSGVLTTTENFIITLPNLDPWNNTSGSLSGANKFPTGDNLHNGAIWNSFLNCEARVDISISVANGVVYYKNGVKMVEYKASEAVGTGTVAQFAELVLKSVKENGFKFAAGNGVGEVSNLSVYTAALTYDQIVELNLARKGAVALEGATFGNDDKTGYDNANYTVTQKLVKGSSIELYGTQNSTAAHPYESITVQLVNGVVVRTDNYIDEDYAGATLEKDTESAWNGNIDPSNYIEDLKTLLAKKDLHWIATVSWGADDKISINIKLYTDTDSYSQDYVLKAKAGATLPTDGFEVKILNNVNKGVVTHMVYTAPKADA